MPDNRISSTESLIGHDIVIRFDNYGGVYKGELYARNGGWWIQRANGEEVYLAKSNSYSVTHDPKKCGLCHREARLYES